MNNRRYKQFLENGDMAISKRSFYRHKDVLMTPSSNEHPVQKTNSVLTRETDVNEYNMDNVETVYAQEIPTSREFVNDIDEHLHNILLQEKLQKCSRSSQNLTKFDEMINNEDFFRPTSLTINKSKGELLLMLLKFSITNSLSVTGMTNLFKLVNIIFEDEIVPDSRYFIDKFFNPQDKVEFHAVCPYCTAYVGKFGEIDNIKNCRICAVEVNMNNPSNSSFFVLLNPTSQIKDIINTYQDHYEYVVKERIHEDNYLTDVYDGKEYRKFVNSLSAQEKLNYVTTIFNTDGASKFKCSRYSIWPLYLMINELPKQQRMTNLITCGLWFNNQKPDMSVFLGTFVEMMDNLKNEGVTCVINGEERTLKINIVNCCVDSVARAPIQGVKQFNGSYGCSWCLHPSVWVENATKYPLLEFPIDSREHEQTIQDMIHATPENPANGIKYPSPLINLTSFNIITGFVPDYMHCCLAGVAQQLTEYHIMSMNNDDIQEIDTKLHMISAPHQISRLTRPISIRKDWKAREWENYILYYSVVVLADHLNSDHYYHWLLFVESLYILLQERIHVTELNRANEMLYEFVLKTEKYFGKEAMMYNIHQLLHLADSVMNWGPLWCHSTFSFESGNQKLMKAIKCSKGVGSQIVRLINIDHFATVLKERAYSHVDELIKIYCDDILDSRVQNYYKTSNITYFGKGKSINEDLQLNLNLSRNAKFYSKIIKDGCLYESDSQSKRRSNNSFVLLNNGTFVQIDKFIVDENQEYMSCKVIRTRNFHRKYYPMWQLIENIEEEHTIIPSKIIKTICIYMKILGKKYLIPLPNLLHY